MRCSAEEAALHLRHTSRIVHARARSRTCKHCMATCGLRTRRKQHHAVSSAALFRLAHTLIISLASTHVGGMATLLGQTNSGARGWIRK